MKEKVKFYLDFIPLAILLVSAGYLIWFTATSQISLVWKHYVGLLFLFITSVLFFVRHLFGVLLLGATLVLGLVGLLSYNPAIITYSFGLGGEEEGITLLRFQPIFLLWLVIYLIICWRHILGIGTQKYWEEVRNKQR